MTTIFAQQSLSIGRTPLVKLNTGGWARARPGVAKIEGATRFSR